MEDRVKVGDLVQYKYKKGFNANENLGLIIAMKKGDYLIQWTDMRRWYVEADWIKVIQEGA